VKVSCMFVAPICWIPGYTYSNYSLPTVNHYS